MHLHLKQVVFSNQQKVIKGLFVSSLLDKSSVVDF